MLQHVADIHVALDFVYDASIRTADKKGESVLLSVLSVLLSVLLSGQIIMVLMINPGLWGRRNFLCSSIMDVVALCHVLLCSSLGSCSGLSRTSRNDSDDDRAPYLTKPERAILALSCGNQCRRGSRKIFGGNVSPNRGAKWQAPKAGESRR